MLNLRCLNAQIGNRIYKFGVSEVEPGFMGLTPMHLKEPSLREKMKIT